MAFTAACSSAAAAVPMIVEQPRVFQTFANFTSEVSAATARPPKPALTHMPRSRLTASLQASGQAPSGQQEAPCSELRAILQNTGDAYPSTTFLGVSPPVRGGFHGGAANPVVADSTWKSCAYNASHTNLQALRELDNGLNFLSGSFIAGSPASMSSDATGSWCERWRRGPCRPQGTWAQQQQSGSQQQQGCGV